MRLTKHQEIMRKHHREKMRKEYLPKELCIWFSGLISCDGSVRFHQKKKRENLFSCSLFNTVERDWIEQAKKILDNANINFGISKAGKKYGKQCYELRLSNYEIYSLYQSIKYYKLENFILRRKLDIIERYLKEMRLINE